MQTSVRPLWWIARWWIGAGFALLLVWRIVEVNTVLYDLNGRPGTPSFSTPESSDPSANVATSLRSSQREMLFGMLRQNPSDAATALLLAREFEREGNFSEASRAYGFAYQLAPSNATVLHDLARFSVRQGDIAAALGHMEKLMDLYPDPSYRLFPVMAELVSSGRQPRVWEAIVARDPAWLGDFLHAACNGGTDPGVLAPLLFKRIAAGKATPNESSCMVEHLRSAGRWDDAYLVWLNTLPRERRGFVGYVFNGGFEYPLSGAGFDWIPTNQEANIVGHSVETAPAAGATGKRALRITYNGKRQQGSPIAQFLALVPGHYQLSGRVRIEDEKLDRGVQWTLRCVVQSKPQPLIANSEPFKSAGEWRPFAFDVTIPEDCKGQTLQLEAVGIDIGMQFPAGIVWFDDLVLRQSKS